MIVPRCIANFELHCDFGVKGIAAVKIFCCEERQPIQARIERPSLCQELCDTAVAVGGCRAGIEPSAARLLFQTHAQSGRRQPPRCVQDMRADPAHGSIILSRRNRVILSCSSAATRNSASGSFGSLDLRIASISSALFPLAQTMNMNPNFAR